MCFIPFLFISSLVWRWRNGDATILRAASLVSRTAGIPPFRHSLPELARELARARRYQRPLSVLVLGLGSDQLSEHLSGLLGVGGDGEGAARLQLMAQTTQLVSLVLGPILREVLRESDIVTYGAVEDEYVIMLAESDESQARRAVRRIDELFHKRTFAHLRAGVAEFPADGLTLQDLVASARISSRREAAGECSRESPLGREES